MVEQTDTVDQVKSAILEQIKDQGNPSVLCKLTFNGKELDEAKTLFECGIQHQNVLRLTRKYTNNMCNALQQNREQVSQAYFEIRTVEVGIAMKITQLSILRFSTYLREVNNRLTGRAIVHLVNYFAHSVN